MLLIGGGLSDCIECGEEVSLTESVNYIHDICRKIESAKRAIESLHKLIDALKDGRESLADGHIQDAQCELVDGFGAHTKCDPTCKAPVAA